MFEMKRSLKRSVSLHDRVNKSDTEDKSLSNDETPLPTCPRQPPDGVETPNDVVEKAPELPSRLPPKLPVAWGNTRNRYSYSSRTQDARSEASVKDKIAMFSNDNSSSSDRLEKCGTLPSRNPLTTRKSIGTYSNSYSEVSTLDRRLTKSQDNLDDTLYLSKKRHERPEAMGGAGPLENGALNSNYSNGNSNRTFHVETKKKPLFYGSTSTISSTMETVVKPVYHVRSISDDSGNKNTHKSNLEYLIEQRKKSMSKLRGLVIPESHAPIVDLPEIKVQDTLSKSFLTKTSQNNSKVKEYKNFNLKPLNLNENKWKSNLTSNNVPKYSPAFKRKSLQVYTASVLSKDSPQRKYSDILDSSRKIEHKYDIAKLTQSLGPLNGAERMTQNSQASKLLSSTRLSNNYKNLANDLRDFKNIEIKICTTTDVVDSDNDSAMSSTQSSYRSSASSPLHNLDSIESDNSRISPRISNYSLYSQMKSEIPTKNITLDKNGEPYVKRNVCRSMSSETNVSLSSSVGSAATSGSQASCSSLESSVADTDKVKNSKSYNIDTINRRNILASAKCRSGRDDKLKSPVIEKKFVHESHDNLQSPVNTSDRLSTLTSSVSALSIKGDSRRRNKKVADSETDSDSDNNVRKRKSDFKNTRLKRNSSNCNKNKNNDCNLDITKVEDVPKIISDKVITEIKKPGFDNLDRNGGTKNVEQENNEMIGIDNFVKNEDLKVNKQISRNQIITTETVSQKTNFKDIKEVNKTKNNIKVTEKSGCTTQKIRLKRGAGTGVGLILAGGIDCEAKDVTVHRVLEDSVAAKAGLKRGVKVISINGCSVTGLTHAQSVAVLKEQRLEVVIEIENEIQNNVNGTECGSDIAESKVRRDENNGSMNGVDSVVSVSLDKAGGGAGLGFGLDGGRDSPNGDRPLTIKKLFAGGAAAQSGRILVGAELLSAGGQSMEGFTRTQAWAALKALPVGPVSLVLRNPK